MTKFNYTRIVSYGCSFTAGSELTDHDIIGITEEELLETIKKQKFIGSREVYDYYKINYDTRKKILESNRSKSWPNYIANYYGIPLVNRARPGTSLSHATYSLLCDIHKKEIRPTDLILIGITSPNRWFQFTEKGETFYGVFNRGWTFLRHPLASEKYREELEKNWYNLYNIIYTHYKEMQFLSNLSNNMSKQIKLCYAIGSSSFIKFLFPKELPTSLLQQLFPTLQNTEQQSKDSEFFDFCQSLVSHENFLAPDISLGEITPRNEFVNHHAFGHPRVEYHKQYANILIEELEKMYND